MCSLLGSVMEEAMLRCKSNCSVTAVALLGPCIRHPPPRGGEHRGTGSGTECNAAHSLGLGSEAGGGNTTTVGVSSALFHVDGFGGRNFRVGGDTRVYVCGADVR